MFALLVVDGPSRGRTLPLTPGTFILGREPACALCLEGDDVQPQHARITVQPEHLLLEALPAGSSLWADGEQLAQIQLVPGSIFEIGKNVLLLEEAPGVDEDRLQGEVRVQNSCDPEKAFEAGPAHPGPGGRTVPESDRSVRHRRILYQASLTLTETESEETLRLELVRLVQEGTGADRVFLFARTGTTGVWTPSAAAGEKLFRRSERKGNRAVPRQGPRFSQSVIRETLRGQRSILCTQVAEDARFASAASLALFNIESVLAIPLLLERQIVAILYADIIGAERRLTADDLSLATALAHHASVTLRKLSGIRASRKALSTVTDQLRTESQLIGTSKAMAQLRKQLDKVAPTDATVLIRGESGTGKELAARYLHYHSPRAERPFIAINCAALSRDLLESELFGHAKGSFTGAIREHVGRFQQADGGTLFLDEIGEMDPGCQAKLLRALETRRVSPVGSPREVPVDVRILAGTNRDLEQAARDGSFREDFYYRLRVFEMRMPPLRDRPDDLESLLLHFVQFFDEKLGKRVQGVTPAVLGVLKDYPWPGNIRELRNVVETAMILTESEFLDISDLPHYFDVPTRNEAEIVAAAHAVDLPATSMSSLDEVELAHILRVLEATQGNKLEAAKILKISRRGLYHRLRRHGVAAADDGS